VIDFRYHLVSIVAVFLALAIGLLIGSTSLRPEVAANLKQRTDRVVARNTQLSGELRGAQAQLKQDEKFDAALEPFVIGGRLAGYSVTLVSAPGADGAIRDQLLTALRLAGATVAGDVRLQTPLLDPQQDAFLGSLVAQLPNPRRTSLRGTGAERAVGLLAEVLATRPDQSPVASATSSKVLSAYVAGKLLSISGAVPRPASLVVLLAAAAPAAPDTATTTQLSLLTEFARQLHASAVGTVVVGPSDATDPGGLLAAVRADSSTRAVVSTVDTAEQSSGIINTVLALDEQATGHAGSYGTQPGATAPVPTPSPS
jgi:hypothetical protein